MKLEYFTILIFLLISGLISSIILAASYFLSSKNIFSQSSDAEKVSAYECGFSPFDLARSKFDVRYYLIAILFIIFDLEVSFLFPWSVVLSELGPFGFWTMYIFLIILTVGFIYEWQKGALEWD